MPKAPTNQKHLGYKARVNLGSYYTPPDCVDLAWNMLQPHIDAGTIVMDSACGYGNFLRNADQRTVIGCDLDEAAIEVARKNNGRARFFRTNALHDVRRSKFKIPEKSKLALVGNPPYNDKTSMIRRKIKDVPFVVDEDVLRRDLGLSFLLSYDKLKADWVCVLHPLSYLIKPANFKLLGNFTANYRLLDGLLLSSGEFSDSSKSTPFPILIALYGRYTGGMGYDLIRSFRFKTKGEACFRLDDFDYIPRYVDKYPSKKNPAVQDADLLFFWTMRDINALKRNRTFLINRSTNAIAIDRKKLDYYAYVDVFKRNVYRLPFYFGNCDVMIDDELFKRYRMSFLKDAVERHPFLERYIGKIDTPKGEVENGIDAYFRTLLGGHHVG